MLAFTLRRAIQAIGVMIAVGVISFSMFRFAGDPVNQMVGIDTPYAERMEIRKSLGLDDPVLVQFARYFANAAQFKFGKTESETQKAFDDHRMQFQTKPMLISGAEAFWSSKTGQMNLRKGRAWVTVSVGPQKLNERDLNDAKKLAEILAKKM